MPANVTLGAFSEALGSNGRDHICELGKRKQEVGHGPFIKSGFKRSTSV